ncbi:MAG: hypothetical protein M1569_01475 [Candidatus Marsarchaeota archaeon]|nr:hypothetical protein [Candidatus Marsarchaeota archaeon]MCL5413053.1 hypothetical protein [Candidatus Marsarchaeota archaeon]
MPYEDTKPRFEKLLSGGLSDKKLTQGSRSLIKEHMAFMQARGRDVKTSIKHLYCPRVFLKFAESKLDFKMFTRKDVQKVIVKVEIDNLR